MYDKCPFCLEKADENGVHRIDLWVNIIKKILDSGTTYNREEINQINDDIKHILRKISDTYHE